MNVSEVLGTAKESVTVKRVFGEPYERDGLVLVPAATVAGGGGAGTGQDENGHDSEGGGFGMAARPAGAYVIQGGRVTWRPAVDVNRLAGVVGMVLVTYFLTRPRTIRAKAARTRGTGG